MFSYIVRAIKALKPPSMDDDDPSEDMAWRVQRYDQRNRRWRWVVFVWLLSLSWILVGAIAVAWGQTPWGGGFARDSDLSENKRAIETLSRELESLRQSVTKQVNSARMETMEGVLLDLRWKQCQAIGANQPVLAFTYQIKKFQEKYQAINQNGTEYSLPGCEELR